MVECQPRAILSFHLRLLSPLLRYINSSPRSSATDLSTPFTRPRRSQRGLTPVPLLLFFWFLISSCPIRGSQIKGDDALLMVTSCLPLISLHLLSPLSLFLVSGGSGAIHVRRAVHGNRRMKRSCWAIPQPVCGIDMREFSPNARSGDE